MKKPLLLVAALAACSFGMAQEVGRVISSTPVMEQVGVPRNVCAVEQVAVQQPKSGAGAVMGAIAGGAMGNAIGQGGGRAVATMVGLMGGAILGDRIEGNSAPQLQNVQRCTTQTYYENRVAAYNVVYDYAGKRYQVQMPTDPGPTIRINVSPVGASVAPEPSRYTSAYEVTPRYVPPTPVVVVPPVHLQYSTTVYRPVVVAQNEYRVERRVDRRFDRRDDRRDDWQDQRREWRDGH